MIRADPAAPGQARAANIDVITGGRGQRFRVLTWPAPRGAGLLVIHHGHGEHAGRWGGLAAALEGLPLTVAAHALPTVLFAPHRAEFI